VEEKSLLSVLFEELESAFLYYGIVDLEWEIIDANCKVFAEDTGCLRKFWMNTPPKVAFLITTA
jgi:hypothetical protein